jgi:hypothetical protein
MNIRLIKKNTLDWIKSHLVAVLYTILFLSVGLIISKSKSSYDFFNNQSIAVLLGASGIFWGYSLWQKQHRIELLDRYFHNFLETTFYESQCIFEQLYNAENAEINPLEIYKLQSKQDVYLLLIESLGEVMFTTQIKHAVDPFRNNTLSLLKRVRDKQGNRKEILTEY